MGASCVLAGANHRCSISSCANVSIAHKLAWAHQSEGQELIAHRTRRASRLCKTYRFDITKTQPVGGDAPVGLDEPLDAKRSQESLQRACRAGDFRSAVDAIAKGADIHTRNLQGQIPLMLAAASSGAGSAELLAFLIDALAELETRDDNGWTALHHACRNGRRENVEYLMQRGALSSACTRDGKTCATLACLEGDDDLVLHLIAKKAKVNKADDKGWPVLLYACEGSLPLVKALLHAKADPKVRSQDHITPFMFACMCGNLPVCRYLVDKKASVNAVTTDGDSALMLVLKSAGQTTKDQTCLFLLSQQIDILHRNGDDADAFEIAEDLGLYAIRNVIDKFRTKAVQAREIAQHSAAHGHK